MVESDPRFHLPSEADLSFNWVHADLAALDPSEARELVVDAWRMVVPKSLSRAYDFVHPEGPRLTGPAGGQKPSVSSDRVAATTSEAKRHFAA